MKKFRLKVNWKQASRLLLFVLMGAGFLLSLGFTENRRGETLCREVSIRVDDSLGNSFVLEKDIEQLIRGKFGALIGKPLHSINISLLEKIIDNNPFVLKGQVFSSVDGKLQIEVRQRVPVVRVINVQGESFYIDEYGVLMPLNEKFSAPVLVANGNIFNRETEQRIRAGTEKGDTSFHPTSLEKVFMVSAYIHSHEFWDAQIEQLYVNADGQMELIPRVGNQTILFGDETEIEEKFNKLLAFYKDGLSQTGWNKYTTINLTFKDQVVCTKK